MPEPATSSRDDKSEPTSPDGSTIDLRFRKAAGEWTTTVLAIRNSSRARRQRTRRKARIRAVLQGTAEILAGVVLAIAAVAAAFTTTTSANLRLVIAIPLIIAAVYAEWGLRVAVRRARQRRNPSSGSQAHNLSNRRQNRRSSRG